MHEDSRSQLEAFSVIDFEAELNPEQYAAVTAPDGPALVLAGAGSGKTRTLTYRVAYLLEQGVRPDEILLLTFTNKAAREMLGRVEALTGIPGWKFWGGTFHRIGQRILRLHGDSLGLEKNFTIMDQGDAEHLLGNLIRTLNPAYTKNKQNPKPRVVADLISYARNTCQPLVDVVEERYWGASDLAETLDAFAKAYEQQKRERQLCDYDDLLELSLRLVQENENIRQHFQDRFKHILVDEYQDTNRIQGRLIHALGEKHRNVMIVGDNWQCIYTWRGAEFANMAQFTEKYPERRIYKIETNYRSTPGILDFANRMMTAHSPIDGYPLELKAHKPSTVLPYVIPTLDTGQQARYVLSRIEALSQAGRPLKDIAILYRAHYQAMDLQLELSRSSLPFTITSGVRFFEQAHIRDLVAQLRLAFNPRDSAAFSRLVMLLPRVGTRTAERLLQLIEKTALQEHISFINAMTHETVLKKVPKEASGDYRALGSTLQELERAMGGGTQTVESIQSNDLDASLFKMPDHAPRQPWNPEDDTTSKPTSSVQRDIWGEVLENEKRDASAESPQEIVQRAIQGWYAHYMKTIFDNWQSRQDDLDSLLGFAGRYESMQELLTQLVLLNSETSDRSIDPAQETVKLTTIHQAKGLEFPVVFVIGLAEGLLPLNRAIESGDTEEERRLAYVAVTRAQDELYLSFPKISSGGGPPQYLKPSRFLGEIPSHLYELLHLRSHG